MQKKFLMVCWSCWSWLMKLTKGVLSLAHVVNRSRCSRSVESWWDWTISWSQMLHTLLWSYMGAANTRGKCWQAVMKTMLWAQNSQFGVFDYKFFFCFRAITLFQPDGGKLLEYSFLGLGSVLRAWSRRLPYEHAQSTGWRNEWFKHSTCDITHGNFSRT